MAESVLYIFLSFTFVSWHRSLRIGDSRTATCTDALHYVFVFSTSSPGKPTTNLFTQDIWLGFETVRLSCTVEAVS